MDKVYIILPVHNRRDITKCFIECLKSQTYQNYHLILVDDGSTDGTEEMVKEKIQSLTVLKGKGNWWWAGSLQQGINWLKNKNSIKESDLVLIVNDDVTFDRFLLEKAISILQNKYHCLLLAQGYGIKTNHLMSMGLNVDFKSLTIKPARSLEEINCLSTRGLFLRLSDLKKIGNFFPKLLPHYLSDYEFTIRAYNKGLKLLIDPGLKLYSLDETDRSKDILKTDLNFSSFLKRLFSRKSPINPIDWTVFVILTCPKIWIPINIARVWRDASIRIARYVLIKYFGYLKVLDS